MTNVKKFNVAEYHVMVSKLAKPGGEILDSMTKEKWALLGFAIMRVIEQGNLLDLVKKATIYNKDIKGLEERLGFYMPPTPTRDISSDEMHALHMAIGIAGEAAELLQNVYEKIVLGAFGEQESWKETVNNQREELGDLEFYMEGFRQYLLTTRESILSDNIEKLSVRYAKMTYSDAAAQARVDKASEEIPDRLPFSEGV